MPTPHHVLQSRISSLFKIIRAFRLRHFRRDFSESLKNHTNAIGRETCLVFMISKGKAIIHGMQQKSFRRMHLSVHHTLLEGYASCICLFTIRLKRVCSLLRHTHSYMRAQPSRSGHINAAKHALTAQHIWFQASVTFTKKTVNVVSLGTVNVSSSASKDEETTPKPQAVEKKSTGPPRVLTPKDFYDGTRLVRAFDVSAYSWRITFMYLCIHPCVYLCMHVFIGSCSTLLGSLQLRPCMIVIL
jgi:hypothetical protein